jgi:hypothetical protein
MPQRLLIEGVEYSLWILFLEEKEFHPIIKQQAKYLFGELQSNWATSENCIQKNTPKHPHYNPHNPNNLARAGLRRNSLMFNF